MLDWIFEGIVTWISSVVSDMMDAVSGLFLQALGTDTVSYTHLTLPTIA